MKTKVIGPGADEMKEANVLNRTVRITSNGWEYEADQRHADLIIRGLNLILSGPYLAISVSSILIYMYYATQ